MRKITQDAFRAFRDRRTWQRTGNGWTHTDGTTLYLHGNAIAEHRVDGVYICDGGYLSRTTKERLKPFATVTEKAWQAYLYLWKTGNPARKWDGKWTYIGYFDGLDFVQVDEQDLTPEERQQAVADRIRNRLETEGYSEELHKAYAKALGDKSPTRHFWRDVADSWHNSPEEVQP